MAKLSKKKVKVGKKVTGTLSITAGGAGLSSRSGVIGGLPRVSTVRISSGMAPLITPTVRSTKIVSILCVEDVHEECTKGELIAINYIDGDAVMDRDYNCVGYTRVRKLVVVRYGKPWTVQKKHYKHFLFSSVFHI